MIWCKSCKGRVFIWSFFVCWWCLTSTRWRGEMSRKKTTTLRWMAGMVMALRAPILALLSLRQDLQGERAGPRQGNSRRMGHRPQGLPAMVGLYIHLSLRSWVAIGSFTVGCIIRKSHALAKCGFIGWRYHMTNIWNQLQSTSFTGFLYLYLTTLIALFMGYNKSTQ